jgi:hypothetical protein
VGGQTYSYSKVLKGAGTHEFVIAAEDKNAQCIIYVEENTPNIHLLKTNTSILWPEVGREAQYLMKERVLLILDECRPAII